MVKTVLARIWLFIAVSLWTLTLAVYTVAPENVHFNAGMLGSSIGVTALFMFVRRRQIRDFFAQRSVRASLSAGFAAALVACIFGMVNYLGVKTSVNLDLTASKLHTLSDQSISAAKQIKDKLTITLFAKREDWEKHLPLLRQYENENKNIVLRAVDIEANPLQVKLNKIEANGSILLETGGKKLRGLAGSELEVTNLLIKTLRDRRLKVYYTVGHGELDRHNEEPNGGSHLFNVLNNGDYQLKALSTLEIDAIPQDADVLMILGPQDGFLDMEIEHVEKYLERGGNVFVLLGPNFKKTGLENLRAMMQKRGIVHHNALVLDRLSAVQGANATIPIVNRYNHEHSITKNFSGRTLFPLSAAVTKKEVEGTEYASLATSSPFPASWAEAQLEDINSGQVFYTKGIDIKGPVDMLAVAENKKDFGKLAVGTSVDFVSNAYQNQSSNFNLFMNTLAWLMDDEGVISLNRPALANNLIILSAPQITLIFYFSILFLPFALFGLAVWIYRKRLHR